MDPVDSAQSPAPGSDTQNPTGQGEAQNDGQSRLNARFAELTAIINGQKEQVAQSQALVQQLLSSQAQLQQQLTQNHRAPEPQGFQIQLPDGVDPVLAQTLQGMTQAFQKTLEEQNKKTHELIQQAVGGVRMTQEQMELQQAVQGQPKEVGELANRLYHQWRQAGNTGWTPQDAVVYARGKLGVAGQTAPGRQTIEHVTPGGAPPPSPNSGQGLPPPLPDEVIRKMSLKQQEDYWAKRVGDTPLEY